MTITKKDFKDHCQNLIDEISSILNPILEKKPAKVFVGYGFRHYAINKPELGEEFCLLDDYEIKHVLIKEVSSLVECMRGLPKVRGKLPLGSPPNERYTFMSQFDILRLAEAETPLKSDADQSLEADSYPRFLKRIIERDQFVLDEIDGDRVIVLRVLTDLAYSILTFERGLKTPETNSPVDELNFYDRLHKLKFLISLNEKEPEIEAIKKDAKKAEEAYALLEERIARNQQKADITAERKRQKGISWVKEYFKVKRRKPTPAELQRYVNLDGRNHKWATVKKWIDDAEKAGIFTTK